MCRQDRRIRWQEVQARRAMKNYEELKNYEEYEVRVYPNGAKHWYKNGQLHRPDGPAVELANGAKHWYKNGQLHRPDGPAIEHADGNKVWYFNGTPNRYDGPAIENADGSKHWYIEGKQYTEEEFNIEIAKRSQPSCAGKIVEFDGKKYRLEEL